MLTLRKFDLKKNVWSAETEVQPVIYRDTLLSAMYPDLDIAIGDVSGFVKTEEPDIPGAIAAMDAGFEGYRIVGASGSRKKGHALFVRGDNQDCFSRFFGSPSNCINYGSNLVTECSKTYEVKATILVVEDGKYGTGDCHGKCSRDFALGTVGQLQRPFQFRAAVKAKHSWVAKGTVAFAFDIDGYDLILPVSCFKGNKVKPGVYSPKTLYFGVVHEAEVRHVKMSYSVTQYLPWSAIEQDILPGTITQAQKLVHLQSNYAALAQFLLADNSIDCDQDKEEEESDHYVSPLAEIVEADVHGQLIEHPWVVRHIRDLLKKRWTRLATAGAVQFQSAMAMPDDNLPDNTVCIPHLPEGEVIVFPYPCRWKWDLKVWNNIHTNTWRGYEGIVAGSHSTMLSLGRDYDGDFLQFLPASLLPNVAAAVKSFGQPPALTKPAKQKIEGTLAEIAVRSMDNCVGLITYAIAKAWAVNNHQVIPRLAQELQIEVDSLKNVQRADRDYIASVLQAMGSTEVAWLKDHKEPDVFITRPIAISGEDTISRLAQQVNAIWEPMLLKERSLIEFRDLFPADFPESWRERATQRRNEYNKKITAASVDGTASIRSVVEEIRALGTRIPEHQKMTAASAFWHVCHVQKSGTASFVFHAFLEQIKERLAEQRFARLQIVGFKYGDFAQHCWAGESATITIAQCADERFSDRLEARIGNQRLGLLASDSAKYPAGAQLNVTLTTNKGTVVARVSLRSQ
jgi:hypothetical protein